MRALVLPGHAATVHSAGKVPVPSMTAHAGQYRVAWMDHAASPPVLCGVSGDPQPAIARYAHRHPGRATDYVFFATPRGRKRDTSAAVRQPGGEMVSGPRAGAPVAVKHPMQTSAQVLPGGASGLQRMRP